MITGNYNDKEAVEIFLTIIPYQVIIGNYNKVSSFVSNLTIIPYQVITGNYNWKKQIQIF